MYTLYQKWTTKAKQAREYQQLRLDTKDREMDTSWWHVWQPSNTVHWIQGTTVRTYSMSCCHTAAVPWSRHTKDECKSSVSHVRVVMEELASGTCDIWCSTVSWSRTDRNTSLWHWESEYPATADKHNLDDIGFNHAWPILMSRSVLGAPAVWNSLSSTVFECSSLSVFTVWLHEMQCTVLSRHFCPSVCLSVKHLHCDTTKENCSCILISHERTIILVFQQEEWLAMGDPLYLKFWAKLTVFQQKCRFSINIYLQYLSRNT